MLPDFIGIGAQRSGSTWLDNNLRLHPDLWLSPVKELHYFDGKGAGIPDGIWKKFFTAQWPHKRYRRLLLSRLKAKTKSCNMSDWAWDYRYFFKPQDDQWYASLFDQGRGKCTGEITPAYTMLEDYQVAEIYSLMPDTKILFLLRNPIDRSWSQVILEFSKQKGRTLESFSDQEWEEALSHRRVVLRSDYIRTLDIWGNYFPSEQILVGMFDDILMRPRELLMDVYNFLEVRAREEFLPPGLGKAVNSGQRVAMPKRWEQYLARQYIDQIRELNDRLEGRVASWLTRAELLVE